MDILKTDAKGDRVGEIPQYKSTPYFPPLRIARDILLWYGQCAMLNFPTLISKEDAMNIIIWQSTTLIQSKKPYSPRNTANLLLNRG
jgi:hypothetical protein